MIDGATPLDAAGRIHGRGAAAWLSDTASALLRDVVWAGRSLPDVLASVIERLADLGAAHGLFGAEFPTAAISLVRQVDDRVEVCSLGDCSVLVGTASGKPVAVTDPQFAGAEEAALAGVRDRMEQGIPPADAYLEIREILRQRRSERNSPAGLWVLAGDPEAARHAAMESLPAPPGTDIVLMSDGFSRVLWPFGLVDDMSELMERVTAGGAASLLDELRAAEVADPDCRRVPRFGVHDDATVVWARM
ncbi:protein phosphatase 2C domain-containing protein [Frankia sp. CNm7]|uniref:Protein phosphatase 2C domain-containing protein n=1 Tax=Frankia nepalensis TaxID=1836974 RepID=A0A937USL5_9ACTN|nr:protein phosphatase 2C domain-containing protein [Frankia nepalensis]MBL7497931.1 protein phosphatase 2C domain-containing protein [Frankia nepalensis]MBL7510890.1 protein phosphatase 2C domain-containing protein [Frankia nepalensis]MBL7522252.1 protein phosphatase 2C domain-containing protein [Frankia nepalensis]MBL7630390.1 protein phosphatase 2C domain-containing protein [Frankia nepalensis]